MGKIEKENKDLSVVSNSTHPLLTTNSFFLRLCCTIEGFFFFLNVHQTEDELVGGKQIKRRQTQEIKESFELFRRN